jgi:hypothetical protein
MHTKKVVWMIGALIMMSGLVTQASSLLTNGSFEDQGMFPAIGFNGGRTITGWSYSGGGVGIAPSLDTDGTTSREFIYNVPIPDGSLVAFIFSTGSLSQNVVLTPGEYTLSWYEALRLNYGDVFVPRTVSVTNSGGTVIQSSSANVSNKEAFALQTMTFTVPVSGTYTLSFASDGNSYLMDNVAITAVPEPVTIGLIALGGLVGLRRRNRA